MIISTKPLIQKGNVMIGVIILAFFLLLSILLFALGMGYIKQMWEGPCNWLNALDKILSSGLSNNFICNAISGGGGASGGSGASGSYIPATQWNCDETKVIDPATLGDPTAAFDGGINPPTVIYQFTNTNYVGYINGSIAWRGNNPGNIISATNDPNKIGNNGRFAIFKNPTAGYNAIINLLEGKVYSNLTITDALKTYAPPIENPTDIYIANVVKAINDSSVTASTKLSDLSSSNITKLADAIKTQEGWLVGTIEGGCIAKPDTQEDFSSLFQNHSYSKTAQFNFDITFGNELLNAIQDASTKNPPIIISVISGTDGQHATNSNHKRGLAADLYATRNGMSICEQSITANKNAGRSDGACDPDLISLLKSYGIKNTICYPNVPHFGTESPKGSDHWVNDGDCNHFSTTGG